MKKNIIRLTLFFLFICIILVFSLYKTKTTNIIYDDTKDVNLEVAIDNYNLDVTFYGGNLIRNKINYGDKIEKIIKVTNPYDEIVTIALSIKELEISNDNLIYNLLYSDKKDSNYKELVKNEELIKDMNLGYNLGIEGKASVYFKLIIVANEEGEKTNIEGKIDVVTNLSKKELFIKAVDEELDNLKEKIQHLKGISEAGYYYYKVDKSLNGYILIDASDISDLKYILTLYNNDLMVKSLNYKNLSKGKISKNDKDFTDSLSDEVVCKLFTKKTCYNFSSVKENTSGGKGVFYKETYDVINNLKKTHKNVNKNIIYDISEDIENKTSIKGYILVSSKNEYYLYLRNNMYMISGYNMTKNGDFKEDSITIRAYNESAFNLSSRDKTTVCKFSGFNECYNKSGDKIG